MSKKLTKRQVIELAKDYGLYITENHNAINVAKNLYDANQRIVELELIVTTIPVSQEIKNYKEKWLKSELIITNINV